MISLIIALGLAVLLWHGSRVEKSLDQAIEIAEKIRAAIRDGEQVIIMWELEPWLRAKLVSEEFSVTRDGNFWLISW